MKYFLYLLALAIVGAGVLNGDAVSGGVAASLLMGGVPFLPRFAPDDGAGSGGSSSAAVVDGVGMTEEQFQRLLDRVSGDAATKAAEKALEDARQAAGAPRTGEGAAPAGGEVDDRSYMERVMLSTRRVFGVEDVKPLDRRNDESPDAYFRRLFAAADKRHTGRLKPGEMVDRSIDGEGWKFQLFRLFNGLAAREDEVVKDARGLMIKAGMYDRQMNAVRASLVAQGRPNSDADVRAAMTTGTQGAAFLPDVALDVIEQIREDFGIARQLCTTWNNLVGTTRVPNTTTRPAVFAVNEGSLLKTRVETFGSVSLDPKKYGVIVPYTTEVSAEVGAQMIQRTISQTGVSFAEKEDQTVWLADGTAAFHSLWGLLLDALITQEHIMGAGDVDFSDIAYADILALRTLIAVGSRANARLAFHHDIEGYAIAFQDGNGTYIFDQNQMVSRMAGKGVAYSEALPAASASAVSTAFGTYGDHSVVNIGYGVGVGVTLLSEATIQDTNDIDFIHLGAQDSLALRFTANWDVKRALLTAIARIVTAAA